MSYCETAACGAALGGVLLSLGVASAAMAGPVDPDFDKLSDSPIAEFRSNGNNTSWSFATGQHTQQPSRMTNSGFDWTGGSSVAWSFAVDASGVPTLTVDGSSVRFDDGLTGEQRGVNTLAIHAKRDVTFTFDFGTAGSGSLSGSTEDPWGIGWSYLSLSDGLDGLAGSGTITFLSPVEDQAYSGVTFKPGNRAVVENDAGVDLPVPGTLALLGGGVLALGAGLRRRQPRPA